MRIDLLHYALIAIIFLLCIVLFNSSCREGAEARLLDKAGEINEIKESGWRALGLRPVRGSLASSLSIAEKQELIKRLGDYRRAGAK